MLSFRINSSLEKMLRESGWGRKDRIRGYLSSLVQFKTHGLKYLLCLEYCGRALGNTTLFSVSIFPPPPHTFFLHLFLLLSSFLPPFPYFPSYSMYRMLSCGPSSQIALDDFEVPLTLTIQLMIILPFSLGTR